MNDYSKIKRKATKLHTWSDEQTKFPLAYTETLAFYKKLDPKRVIALDFRVWMKPAVKK